MDKDKFVAYLRRSSARGLPEVRQGLFARGSQCGGSDKEGEDDCVRGIVVGDVVRRLVARTISQQFGRAVEGATALFQHAFKTRAGCECGSCIAGIDRFGP